MEAKEYYFGFPLLNAIKISIKYFVVGVMILASGNKSKAQNMEVSLLQYHPLGGISEEIEFLIPGVGQGVRFGYLYKKEGYFVVGRIGYIYHLQPGTGFLSSGLEQMHTASVSAQWGMHLYKSETGKAPLIYWILHPQAGMAAYRVQQSFGDERGGGRLSGGFDYMGAFGFGPGFEIGSKYRGFMEAEMGPQVYFPNYYSIKAIYTTFSVGMRF